MGKRKDVSLDIRRLVIAHYLQGRSYRDIAGLMGVSVGSVQKTVKVMPYIIYVISYI